MKANKGDLTSRFTLDREPGAAFSNSHFRVKRAFFRRPVGCPAGELGVKCKVS